jgi:chromosome segregation ATPase
LENERTKNSETIHSLNQQIQEAAQLNESLEGQITEFQKTEQHYHAALETMQVLRAEQEELQSKLETKTQELDKTRRSLEQTRQEQQSLEEDLSCEQRNSETLQKEKQELTDQVQKTAERVNDMQERYQHHQAELEYRKRQFQQELETKEQQIQSLQQRLSETTQQIQEFDPLLKAAHEDNTRLQQTMQKNAQEIAQLQNRIAKKNLEYTALQEKLAAAQNTPIEFEDGPNEFENAQMRIRLLTQDLERELEFNQTARGELESTQSHAKQTEERLARKIEELKTLRKENQETKQELAKIRKEWASLQRASLNVASLEKKLHDANNRVENLGSQVKEQVQNLKNAHQMINFLRGQKASRSYKVPGLDTPGHEVVSPPQPPKNIQ